MSGDHPLFTHRVVPLASVAHPDTIEAIGEGLVAGGLPVVEVALRGEFGMTAVRRLAERDDLLVGAGTVLSVEQARAAVDAGARFLVSPGLDLEVVAFASEAGVPMVPGVITPTEVQRARAAGLTRLKLFPAGVFGGLSLIDAYASVFRDIRFMPSGGVSPGNLTDYLSRASVFAVSGSWITQAAAEGGEAVAARAREAVEVAG
ncbi:bifunctional 4-hydroxy-2-oxoglutarate aldolase/2-dehydro-3-deoxy-phosphogluconate aldolase [Modestobacter sp. SYSU DS0290]